MCIGSYRTLRSIRNRQPPRRWGQPDEKLVTLRALATTDAMALGFSPAQNWLAVRVFRPAQLAAASFVMG